MRGAGTSLRIKTATPVVAEGYSILRCQTATPDRQLPATDPG